MRHNLVTFEQAKALKELEFDLKTNYKYHDDNHSLAYFGSGDYKNHNELSEYFYSAPTLYDAIEWLYDKYNIWIEINFGSHTNGTFFDWTLCIQHDYNDVEFFTSGEWNGSESYFSTPSECMSAGLNAAIEFIKQEKENETKRID